MTKEEITAKVKAHVNSLRRGLDLVEAAVRHALESSPEEMDRMIDRACATSDINEGGDLRMSLVEMLRDFREEQKGK